MQFELEIQCVLEINLLFELDEVVEECVDIIDVVVVIQDVVVFDELLESLMWDVVGSSWQDGDDDCMQCVVVGEFSDFQLCVLQWLLLELVLCELVVVVFWLEYCDDVGYLDVFFVQL